jgi:hypothetical protein
MLHDRWQRHVERPGQFADIRRPARKALDHGASRRIGERREHAIEALRTLRHLLKYRFGGAKTRKTSSIA